VACLPLLLCMRKTEQSWEHDLVRSPDTGILW